MAALAEVRVDALHKEVWHGWVCITRETFRVTDCTFLLAASAAVIYRLVLVATTEPGSESGTHERSPRLVQPHCVVHCGACAHHALSIALPRLQAIHAIARAATSALRSRVTTGDVYYYPAAPLNTTPLSPGKRGAATARGALGWYRPSVGVPRDVGCRRRIRVANLFSVQFSSPLPIRADAIRICLTCAITLTAVYSDSMCVCAPHSTQAHVVSRIHIPKCK